jgi:putative transposase
MNKRDYKEFAPDTIFHVYNRGNNKEKIFFDDQDYRAFMFRIGLGLGFEDKDLNKESVLALPNSRIRITGMNKKMFNLHSFCLMPNHFHLLLEQLGETPISTLLLKVCTSYARYLNKKYNRVGHAFQDNFKAVLMEDHSQLMWTSAYIHMNPVKDGITQEPSEYPWSSYKEYISKRNLPLVHRNLLLKIFENNFEKETIYLGLEDEMSKVPFDI